jgi:hypothetical protein
VTAATTRWETVIGLEVHAELLTVTKLFCGCRNSFGAEPNTNICPVCLGLPGSLPVLNRAAVELAMRIGSALHARVQPSIFHRKNYFYPDMPKDYQISQYDVPINIDGWLELPNGRRIGTHQHRRLAGAAEWAAHRHCARPSGRGHGQDDPRRRRGAHPRRGPLAGGLQPGRRTAGGDRQRPGPA